MKSVIVGVKDGYATILSDDGCIVKIKNRNYEIGQVIEMKKHITKKVNKFAVWAATAATLLIISGVSIKAYTSPYSYVSLDVNPSIEYSVNLFDRVIDVNAVNEDGEEILNKIDVNNLKNKSIENAITQTVEQITEDGYFEGDTEGGIVISTSGENEEDADKLAEDLQETVKNKVMENGDEVVVETISVGLERVQQAKELNVTPGKLNLVEKLQESSSDPENFILEDWLNKPIKEIMSAIKENKKDVKLETADDTPQDDSLEKTTDSKDDINSAVDASDSLKTNSIEKQSNTNKKDPNNDIAPDKVKQNSKATNNSSEKNISNATSQTQNTNKKNIKK